MSIFTGKVDSVLGKKVQDFIIHTSECSHMRIPAVRTWLKEALQKHPTQSTDTILHVPPQSVTHRPGLMMLRMSRTTNVGRITVTPTQIFKKSIKYYISNEKKHLNIKIFKYKKIKILRESASSKERMLLLQLFFSS